MKKTILLILIGMLLISGCAEIEPTSDKIGEKLNEVTPKATSPILNKPIIKNKNASLIGITKEDIIKIAEDHINGILPQGEKIEIISSEVWLNSISYIENVNLWTVSVVIIYYDGSIGKHGEKRKSSIKNTLYINDDGDLVSNQLKIREPVVFNCSNQSTDICNGVMITFKESFMNDTPPLDRILSQNHGAIEKGGFGAHSNYKWYYINPNELIAIAEYEWVHSIWGNMNAFPE